MPDESFPIEIEGETLSLRFEDRDVREIEKTISLFVAFHPTARTYDNASVLLWRSLRRADTKGDLDYAIQQGPSGKEMAFRKVKAFCGQFAGTMGMVILYGSYHKAMVSGGWFGEPKEDAPEKPQQQDSDEKN